MKLCFEGQTLQIRYQNYKSAKSKKLLSFFVIEIEVSLSFEI